jgi:hypothetical protein
MSTQLSILCFLLFVTATATARDCPPPGVQLRELESRGFPASVDVFHGKVERWISKEEVDVQVIEAFSGSREAKRVIARIRADRTRDC